MDSVEEMKAKLSTPPPKSAGRKRRKESMSTDNSDDNRETKKRTLRKFTFLKRERIDNLKLTN